MRMCLASKVSAEPPASGVTSTRIPACKRAVPAMEVTLFLAKSTEMPAARPCTTWSLRASMAATSMRTSPVVMPWSFSSARAR